MSLVMLLSPKRMSVYMFYLPEDIPLTAGLTGGCSFNLRPTLRFTGDTLSLFYFFRAYAMYSPDPDIHACLVGPPLPIQRVSTLSIPRHAMPSTPLSPNTGAGHPDQRDPRYVEGVTAIHDRKREG